MEQESLPREAISELDTGLEWEYGLWPSVNRENSLLYSCDRSSTSGKLADSAAAVTTIYAFCDEVYILCLCRDKLYAVSSY